MIASKIEEKIILKNLITNEAYRNKILPYLSEGLFTENKGTKTIFSIIHKFNETYDGSPNLSVLRNELEKIPNLSASVMSDALDVIEYAKSEEDYNLNWLLDSTVDFIKKQRWYKTILDAAEKYEGGEIDSALPSKLDEILGINLDPSIGLEFCDSEERWELYQKHEDKIPFLVKKLNEITNGGFARKTLNCFMSSNTGGFKSGMMCSLSADYIKQGKNVLYLSFEMAEDKIMERIDANLLHVDIDDIVKMGKERFITAIDTFKEKSYGRLIAKQFPTATAHSGHIKALIKELELKKNFVPDVICFDYIELIMSERYKKNEAMHVILKAVCEELRGICIELNCIGITAQQSNRGGSSAGGNISLSDISASFGTVFGFDLIIALITSPETDADNKIILKQLKNRYGDMNKSLSFPLNMEKAQMRISDTDNFDTMNIVMTTSQEALEASNEAEESLIKSSMINTAKKKHLLQNSVITDIASLVSPEENAFYENLKEEIKIEENNKENNTKTDDEFGMFSRSKSNTIKIDKVEATKFIF